MHVRGSPHLWEPTEKNKLSQHTTQRILCVMRPYAPTILDEPRWSCSLDCTKGGIWILVHRGPL